MEGRYAFPGGNRVAPTHTFRLARYITTRRALSSHPRAGIDSASRATLNRISSRRIFSSADASSMLITRLSDRDSENE